MATLSLSERTVYDMFGLLRAAAAEPGIALPWPFMERLKRLIGCDVLEVSGLDTTRHVDYTGQVLDGEEHEEHVDEEYADLEDPFWRHYWGCLPCSHPDRSGDYASVTLQSDFYTVRQWHATGMYAEHLGRFRVQYEIMMPLPDGRGRSLRLLCFRGPGPDFGERERLLLTLLRPHVAEAYRSA